MAWHACEAEKTAIYIQAPTEQLFHKNIDSSSTRAQAKRLIKRLPWAYRDLWSTWKRRTHRRTITHAEDTHAFTDNHKPAAPILKQQPVLTRGFSLVGSLASAPFISAWWLADEATADVCIFSHRINWTLSSWLMCRRSLLDLDQLDGSRVETTGA